ncbi:hypothetical protein Micbo1qcDRAFT_12860 [Microdochium bolleyi]|uniref:Ankyrin repeat-containing domain protein n=1 Tax=Microdochium bolleyi TaxID=196109 RepID=A0A136IX62_9PEZI|nr:hypothetical protein Micbo1qcDRAFT_12860 [Microdochium bolleyi]
MTAGQLEAFRLLRRLEVGNDGVSRMRDVRDGLPETRLRKFARKLSAPGRLEYLAAFAGGLRSARGGQGHHPRDRDHAVVSFLPFAELVLTAPLELLRTLLDHGAWCDRLLRSPRAWEKGRKVPLTSQSAACFRGEAEILDLVLSHSSSVLLSKNRFHGENFLGECAHIPIYAATQHMSRTGDSAMVRRCIAAGADMSEPAWPHDRPWPSRCRHPIGNEQLEGTHVATTPLVMLLTSFERWDTAARHMVEHLLRDLGVVPRGPGQEAVTRWQLQSYRKGAHEDLLNRTYGGVPAPVEAMLLPEYGGGGVENVANPDFYAVLRLLVEHGGIEGRGLARLLVRVDGEDEHLESLWQRALAELLAPEVAKLSQSGKDALLRRVVVDKAGLANWREGDSRLHEAYAERLPIKIGRLGLASIRMLVRAGANVNDDEPCHTAVDGMNSDRSKDPRTPLQEVVNEIVRSSCADGAACAATAHEDFWAGKCPYAGGVLADLAGFLEFLVADCGADPTVEPEAIDTLLSPLGGGSEHEGEIEQALLRAVCVLKRGEKPRKKRTRDSGQDKRCSTRTARSMFYSERSDRY